MTIQPTAHVLGIQKMASFSVCRVKAHAWSTVEMYSKRKTITRCLCTPPLTLETFGEKISAKACSEEIVGLKTNIMTQIVKLCRSGFSRAKLEAGMNGLNVCIAKDVHENCYWRVLKA